MSRSKRAIWKGLSRGWRKALRAAVKDKWLGMAAREVHPVDDPGADCALCKYAASLTGADTCLGAGCPVAKASGRNGCSGTPFVPFRRLSRYLGRAPAEHVPAFLTEGLQSDVAKAAVRELLFLARFLPRDEPLRKEAERKR